MRAHHALDVAGGASGTYVLSFLFALNAVTNPYAGIVHDASLYSLQALNRATGGSLADDVFLKYGSQDRFSIFSVFVAPIVRVFDVQHSFFVLYLLSVALLLFAATRLIKVLISDRVVATLGAIFVAVAAMPYGGLDVFRVAEPFFTPRIPACALTLLALEQIVRGRLARAAVPLGVAVALHPVMAVPGLLAFCGEALLRLMPPRRAVVLTAACGVLACVLLGFTNVAAANGLTLLDDAWREVVRRAAPYNFLDEWRVGDWANVVGGILILATAARLLGVESPRTATFLWIVVFSAGIGLVATAVASYGPVALIFQAQPYRALWLVALLEGPVGIWLLLRFWRGAHPWHTLAAVCVLVYLTRNALFPLQALVSVVVLPICALGLCIFTNATLRRVVLRSASVAVIAGAVLSMTVLPIFLVLSAPDFVKEIGPVGYVRALIGSPGPAPWLLLAFGALMILRGRRQRIPLALIGSFLLIQVAFYAVPQLRPYQAAFDREPGSMQFARAYVAGHYADGEVSVYSDWLAPQSIWLDLRSKSYFSLIQAAGVMFSRETAEEVMRRATVVQPFEVARYTQLATMLSANPRLMVERLFNSPNRSTGPSSADLVALCSDPSLDIAILKTPALLEPTLSDGQVAIYSCHDIRTRYGSGTGRHLGA